MCATHAHEKRPRRAPLSAASSVQRVPCTQELYLYLSTSYGRATLSVVY